MTNTNSFPQLKDFNNYDVSIIKFSELPVGVIYHMSNVKRLTTRVGKCAFYANFRTECNVHYSAWLPGSLIDKFNDLEVNECFMLNKGLKKIQKMVDLTAIQSCWQ